MIFCMNIRSCQEELGDDVDVATACCCCEGSCSIFVACLHIAACSYEKADQLMLSTSSGVDADLVVSPVVGVGSRFQ